MTTDTPAIQPAIGDIVRYSPRSGAPVIDGVIVSVSVERWHTFYGIAPAVIDGVVDGDAIATADTYPELVEVYPETNLRGLHDARGRVVDGIHMQPVAA